MMTGSLLLVQGAWSATSTSAARPCEMGQRAPYPQLLADLVARLSYRPGWTVTLTYAWHDATAYGLTLVVTAVAHDTDDPTGPQRRFTHHFPVPPTQYHARAWQRWLFERLLDVERHEAMEFFKIDGERPYLPDHELGGDLYAIVERASCPAR